MNRLLKNKQAIFLFMLPVVILFLMIVAAPVFLSGYYSLLEWDGMGKQEFENYDFISGYCHSYGVNKILQKP